MKRRSLLWSLWMSIIILTSCAENPQSHQPAAYTLSGDTIYVDPGSPLRERLYVESVSEEPYARTTVTAGTVQPISNQYAWVASPFAGRVVRSFTQLGKNVAAGTPLFEIISPDFISAQKEFFQAQSEREMARKDMLRKQDLLRNGVTSQRELEEAENMLLIAEKEYENAYAALQIFQVDPENMVLGQPLVVRSPIRGTVIEDNIVAGQYLKDDAEPVAVVADLSKVWITAQVKEKDLRFIREDSEMEIHIPAYPGEKRLGKIFHIDEAVDEETRSVRVMSVCDNSDELFKLGMYVTIHFEAPAAMEAVAPERALLQNEKHTYVLVEEREGVYVRTPVEVAVTREGKAFIASGLASGDKVVSRGGYYLK